MISRTNTMKVLKSYCNENNITENEMAITLGVDKKIFHSWWVGSTMPSMKVAEKIVKNLSDKNYNTSSCIV